MKRLICLIAILFLAGCVSTGPPLEDVLSEAEQAGASAKISALTELDEAPALGDIATIVDVSDTTMAATGTNKKITIENFFDDYYTAAENDAAFQPLNSNLTALAANTLISGVKSWSVTTDANPYTLVAATDGYMINVTTVTTHADNVDLTIGETGTLANQFWAIGNVSANTLILEDDPAVVEVQGYIELEINNWVLLKRSVANDRWEVQSKAVSTWFFANINMVGGTLAMPSTTNPTTDAQGEISLDESDAGQEPLFLEAYDEGTGDASRIIASDIKVESFTIIEPDVAQAACDDIKLKHFIAEGYPFGITILAIHIVTDGTAISDTFLFEAWNDADGSTQTTVESIALSATDTGEDDGTLSDNDAVIADWFFVLNLDDASDDYKSVTVTIAYRINPGD